MSKEKFYITTPIYYPSDKLHIGHTYCTVAADSMARYMRMRGYDVMFLTGTDEHGQKIEEKANAAGVTPQQFVDNIVAGKGGILDLWKLMNISNDRFIRTTDDYHVESIKKIFKKMYDNGDIYKGSYKGLYCTPCEAFWTESQLKDGKCPDCGRDVHYEEEEAYFFRLSKYADRVQALLETGDFLEPASRVNEMINNFIKPGLEDLCVSRTTFTWGIPVDFDILPPSSRSHPCPYTFFGIGSPSDMSIAGHIIEWKRTISLPTKWTSAGQYFSKSSYLSFM